jgi:hypothetical protein
LAHGTSRAAYRLTNIPRLSGPRACSVMAARRHRRDAVGWPKGNNNNMKRLSPRRALSMRAELGGWAT